MYAEYHRRSPDLWFVLAKVAGILVIYGAFVAWVWHSGGLWWPVALFFLVFLTPSFYGHYLDLVSAREVVVEGQTIEFELWNRRVAVSRSEIKILRPTVLFPARGGIRIAVVSSGKKIAISSATSNFDDLLRELRSAEGMAQET